MHLYILFIYYYINIYQYFVIQIELSMSNNMAIDVFLRVRPTNKPYKGVSMIHNIQILLKIKTK